MPNVLSAAKHLGKPGHRFEPCQGSSRFFVLIRQLELHRPDTMPALSSTVGSAKIGAFARSARAMASLGAASTTTSRLSIDTTTFAKKAVSVALLTTTR